jgi:hypothetical protein
MDQREPFFTLAERKATILWRPSEWRAWWASEPNTTKLLIPVLVACLGWGAYNIYRGDGDAGWFFVGIVCLFVGFVLIAQISALVGASTRWLMRMAGYNASDRQRIRKRVNRLALSVFWLGMAYLLIAVYWDYISLSPTRSWYALMNRTPVDHVTIEKMPHDCEFETAPLGSKHCHYQAQALVFPAESNADKKTSVVITYERIED